MKYIWNSYEFRMIWTSSKVHLNFIRIAWQAHKKFLCTTHEYGLWHPCYVFHMNEPPGLSYNTDIIMSFKVVWSYLSQLEVYFHIITAYSHKTCQYTTREQDKAYDPTVQSIYVITLGLPSFIFICFYISTRIIYIFIFTFMSIYRGCTWSSLISDR